MCVGKCKAWHLAILWKAASKHPDLYWLMPPVLISANCACTDSHAEQADKYRQLLLGDGRKQPSRKGGKDWGAAPDDSDGKVKPGLLSCMIMSGNVVT